MLKRDYVISLEWVVGEGCNLSDTKEQSQRTAFPTKERASTGESLVCLRIKKKRSAFYDPEMSI